MKFNVTVAKCHSIRVNRHLPSNQIHFNQQTLEQVRSAKYLGLSLTITKSLIHLLLLSLITWNGVNMFLKFLVKQLRHWVFFGAIWLLHLGIQRKFHTKHIILARGCCSIYWLPGPQLEYAAPIWHSYNETETKRWRKCRRQQPGGSAGDGGTGVATTICWTNSSGHPWGTAG